MHDFLFPAKKLLERYCRLQDFLTSPRSVQPTADEGFIHAKSCVKCGCTTVALYVDHGYYCSNCKFEWQEVKVFLRKGEIQEGKSSSSLIHSALLEFSTIGAQLQRAENQNLWGFRIFCLYSLEEYGGEQRCADEARRRWPKAPFKWTRYRIAQLIDSGARTILKEKRSGESLGTS